MTLSSYFPPTIAHWLAQPDVTDLCINGALNIFVETKNQPFQKIPSPWSGPQGHQELKTCILDLLHTLGKSWDAKNPFVDATLPTGHRIHIVFPSPVSQEFLISIRTRAVAAASPQQERWNGPAFSLLKKALQNHETLLICGATGSGKTTLAQDLLQTLPETERIILLEDTAELTLLQPSWISLLSRPPNADGFGEITLRTLIKQSLRMRPDRLILGECRGPEVMDFLQAIHTGHPGSLCTLHANSAREALRRLELLASLSGTTLPRTLFLDLVCAGIQSVVYLSRSTAQRKRDISEIYRIEGREGDTILLRPLLQSSQEHRHEPHFSTAFQAGRTFSTIRFD